MEYFRINGTPYYPTLTVDSTLITVDSTDITVDQTITGDSYGYRFKCIPRFSGQNPQVIMKNELLDKTFELTNFYYQYNGERLIVYFDAEFKEGDSFEISVLDGLNRLMWRGKGYASAQEDIENFDLGKSVTPTANDKITIMKY